MKKTKLISYATAGLMLAAVALPAYAADMNLNLSGLTLAQLEALVSELTAKIQALKPQVNSQNTLVAKLRLNSMHTKGERGSEISLLQQILSTDPTLYPEGLVTGFFGDLTSRAIARLQVRYGLTVTGTLTAETQELINKILDSEGENAIRQIPPGLLRAPGLAGRVIVTKLNNGGQTVFKIEVKCDSSGSDNTCKDDNEDVDDNDDEDTNDDEDDNDDLEIEVKIDENDARVKVEEGSTTSIFTLDETDEDEIVEKLSTRLGISTDDIEDVIEFDHVSNNSSSFNGDEDDDD